MYLNYLETYVNTGTYSWVLIVTLSQLADHGSNQDVLVFLSSLFVNVGIYCDELFLKLLSLFPISFATFYVYFHVSQSVLFCFFPFLIVSDPFFHWRSSSVEPLC